MAKIMAKVYPVYNYDGTAVRIWGFHCPGCGYDHGLRVVQGETPWWKFNGDVEKPTFSPSLLIYEDVEKTRPRCHSFIRGGQIEFLSDCTHSLAGQTVEIPDWEDE